MNELLSSTNVTVNSLEPGFVNTDALRYYQQNNGCWVCLKGFFKYCCCCKYGCFVFSIQHDNYIDLNLTTRHC